jgi:hypothetical protein
MRATFEKIRSQKHGDYQPSTPPAKRQERQKRQNGRNARTPGTKNVNNVTTLPDYGTGQSRGTLAMNKRQRRERGKKMATYWRVRKGETDMGSYFGEEDVPLTTPEMYGEQWAKCTFCGENTARAYWRCVEKDVSVCRSCAVEVLPRLMADALVGEHGDNPNAYGQVHHHLERVLTNFWQGVTIAVLGTVRCLRRELRN